MQCFTVKNLQTKTHPENKMIFWFLFASSKGAKTRTRIVKLLQQNPFNAHQLSKELGLDYKSIKHHLNKLENNRLLEKFEVSYGASYFLSSLFQENQDVFNEISSKMNFY